MDAKRDKDTIVDRDKVKEKHKPRRIDVKRKEWKKHYHATVLAEKKAECQQSFIDKVKEREGEIIEGVYENKASVYTIKCKRGHIWNPMWCAIMVQNSWCRICSNKDRKKIAWTLELCRELAISKGGECLSESYVNTTTPMKWTCGLHQWDATLASMKRTWCPECTKKVRTSKISDTIEDARRIAAMHGGTCLSKEYVHRPGKMRWKCGKCNHEWDARFTDIKWGRFCPRCSKNVSAAKLRLSIEQVREIGAKRGWELVSTSYKSNKTYLDWRCPYNHVFRMRLSEVTTGTPCRICNESSGETAVRLILEVEGLEYIKEWKMPEKNMMYRYDFYVPSLNLAIEYDGGFHFKPYATNIERFRQTLVNDEIKDRYCEEKKISLFRLASLDTEYSIELWIRAAIIVARELGYYHYSPHREYKARLLAKLTK
jgi:hypothetical protein